MNPYEILIIKRSATPEQVRAAYRRLSKRLHPDNRRTGNAEKFVELTEAHDLLMDPRRRAHYDLTGEIDSAKADNSVAVLMQSLGMALNLVLNNAAKHKQDPSTIDIASGMREALDGLSDKNTKAADSFAVWKENLEKIKNRFEGDEKGHMTSVIRGQVQECDQKVISLRAQAEQARVARAYLNGIVFNSDSPWIDVQQIHIIIG